MIDILRQSDDPSFEEYILGDSVFLIKRITDYSYENNQLILSFKGAKLVDKVYILSNDLIQSLHKHFPTQFYPFLQCSPVRNNYEYFWWRAIAATYFIRPNLATLDLINEHKDSMLSKANGRCISTYVRHGDKAVEMKLVPFSEYSNAIKILSRNQMNENMIFYVGSEDPDVFKEAKKFGQTNKFNIRFSNLSQTILSGKRYFNQAELEAKPREKKELEYFSYILHLGEVRLMKIL
jgi:hypothetical protein